MPEGYDFVAEGTKNPRLCQVRYCRNTRAGANKVCSKCMMRRWRERYPVKAAFSQLRNSAMDRKKPFELTLEQFVDVVVGTGYMERKGHEANSLHVDRKDSTKGYVYDNLQIITNTQNITKENKERATRRAGRQLADNEPF